MYSPQLTVLLLFRVLIQNEQIRVDIMTNTPIFRACQPHIVIEGLEGHETNETMLEVTYTRSNDGGISAIPLDFFTQDMIIWNPGPKFGAGHKTSLEFSVDEDIYIRYDGGLLSGTPSVSSSATLSFKFQIQNQAEFQQPPPLTVYAMYATSPPLVDGRNTSLWTDDYNEPFDWATPEYMSPNGIPPFNTNGLWAVEDTHDWETKHGRGIYIDNAYAVDLAVWTTNAPYAQTSDKVYVSFEVGGAWLPEIELFDYTYQGMQGGFDSSGTYHPEGLFSFDSPPTKLKMRVNGNDGWNFWKIRVTIGANATGAHSSDWPTVDVLVGTDHPNGIDGASQSANADYWLDSDGIDERTWDLPDTYHIPERKPLYIRQIGFLVKNIGQTNP